MGGAVGEVSTSGGSAGSCSGRSGGAVSEVVTSQLQQSELVWEFFAEASSAPESGSAGSPCGFVDGERRTSFRRLCEANAAKRLVAEDVSAAEAFSWQTSSVQGFLDEASLAVREGRP